MMSKKAKMWLFLGSALLGVLLAYLAQACVVRVKDLDIRTKQESDKDNAHRKDNK